MTDEPPRHAETATDAEQYRVLQAKRMIVACLQTLGRLVEGRANLFLRRKRVDRDPEIAHRPFGLGVAAGERKAALRTKRPSMVCLASNGLQYGYKLLPIKR